MPLKANEITGQLRVWVVGEGVGAPASNWMLLTESRKPVVTQTGQLKGKTSHLYNQTRGTQHQEAVLLCIILFYFIFWQVS